MTDHQQGGATTVQHSLLGLGERQEQLRRLKIPSGLKWRGASVKSSTLKSVLEKVDFFDREAEGGQGCFAAAATIAEEMQMNERTIDRALNILTHVLGFLTHETRKEGLKTKVDRRICWAAIRAFNAGEPSEGEGHSDRGKGHPDEGEGHPVQKARDTRVPLIVTVKRNQNRKTEPNGHLVLWSGGELPLQEMRDPPGLVGRFADALRAGVVADCEADRLAFLAWGLYCRRVAEDPPAMFSAGLLGRRDPYGRTWRQKPTAADEDQARRILKDLQRPPDAARRPTVTARASPGERIRRQYGGLGATLLLQAARRLIDRESDLYREFADAVLSGDGLDAVNDELLQSVFLSPTEVRR